MSTKIYFKKYRPATISGPEIKCDLCSFKNEKLVTFNKHINTKHKNQKTYCIDAINGINTKKHSDDGKRRFLKLSFIVMNVTS